MKKGGEEALKTAYGSTSATTPPAEVQGKDTAAMDEQNLVSKIDGALGGKAHSC